MKNNFDYFKLTKQEKKVFNLIVLEGYLTRKKIAEKLVVADCTVANHLNAIYSKLDVHSIAELVYNYYKGKKHNDFKRLSTRNS